MTSKKVLATRKVYRECVIANEEHTDKSLKLIKELTPLMGNVNFYILIYLYPLLEKLYKEGKDSHKARSLMIKIVDDYYLKKELGLQ